MELCGEQLLELFKIKIVSDVTMCCAAIAFPSNSLHAVNHLQTRALSSVSSVMEFFDGGSIKVLKKMEFTESISFSGSRKMKS